MYRLYTDYVINNSPALYEELAEDYIQNFISQSAYKMMKEVVREVQKYFNSTLSKIN